MEVQLTVSGFLAKVRDHKTLRDQVRFYAPLRASLRFAKCIGAAVFTRAGASTAVWADGAAHAVAANQPRFEWSGSRPLGIAMGADETLSFPAANALDDPNTLCWIQDSQYRSTLTHGNIFNAAGQLQFAAGSHYCEIVKWKKVLTAAEDAIVKALMAHLLLAPVAVGDPPPPSGQEQFGTVAIGAGAEQATVAHALSISAIVFSATPNWPTRIWIVGKSGSGVTVGFSVPAPAGGGTLDWGGAT